MPSDLLRAFQILSSEKEAIRKREAKLVADLREKLGRLGYRLETVAANGPVRQARAALPRAAAARPGSLSCPQCGRTFALPLHLGRHMSVTHKTKGGAVPAGDRNGTRPPDSAPKTPQRRTRMSPAARRAAAQRMKAYWKKRKAARRATAR